MNNVFWMGFVLGALVMFVVSVIFLAAVVSGES